MNYTGGLALVRKSLFSFMASRGFFWTLSFSWMMAPLVFLFIWMAVAGSGAVGGFGKKDFIFYYLALIIVNQASYPSSHWTIGESIHAGTLSTWLLRPVPVIYEAVASDLALKIVCLPFVVLFSAGIGIFLGFGTAAGTGSAVLAATAFIMACALRFLAAYTLSLAAFWTQKINSLLAVNDTFVFLLAGQVAPTVLLPGVLRDIAFYLPYRYMLGFPVEVLSGKLSFREIAFGFAVQTFWLLAAAALQKTVWHYGVKRYSAIGG